MDSTDRQVLLAAQNWCQTNHRFALVTVARTWGSAPRPVGSWMALRDDGQVCGSVSGGCLEADLIERMTCGEFVPGSPRLLRYGVTKDEASRFGLPCGGTVELVIESMPDIEALNKLARRIDAGELVRRVVTLGQTGNRILSATRDDCATWDGNTLSTVHGPAWRLLIIGAGQISTYLASMAQAMDYQVVVCDPRVEYASTWSVPNVTMLDCMPDDAVVRLRLDTRSAVVALTHDPKLDDMVLLEALKSAAFYVGALGSMVSSQRRRERLLAYFDLTSEQVSRLRGPVGLPIGSRTPPEIAVAVLAEMTAVRRSVNVSSWRNTKAATAQQVLDWEKR
ncbi:MAG: XdhC family protein [Rhodoferax sp.]|nr:XdhC family protein [Rhodoferax sp.]